MALRSTVSLKVQEGNVIWHKTLRMLKFHPITAFMKTYTSFKTIFLVKVFWLQYIFQIKFKITILDCMLLPKNRVPFEGLYYSTTTTSFKVLTYSTEIYIHMIQ